MIKENIEKFEKASVEKANAIRSSVSRYFILSMLAGIYVGFGIVLIFAIGGPLQAVGSPATKIAMGASFGIALTLVIFAGSELFTGNNMTMTIGSLSKKVSWKDTLYLWIICYIGNLVGSLLLAYGMSKSGLIDDEITKSIIVEISSAKMDAPITQLAIRGILCNMLVCLAVWMSATTKNDAAKLCLIFWCLFAFIGSGFEHSVANMTLLGMGILSGDSLGWSGFMRNMVPVTVGNIIGGALFIGVPYWYVAKNKNNTHENLEKGNAR